MTIIGNDITRNIILASASPRRRQILEMLGVKFTVAKSGVANEDDYFNFDDISELEKSLRKLAAAKAQSASIKNTSALVIGADTTVVIKNKILNKPTDRDDAARMLKKLSGNKHTVITAVALLCEEKKIKKTTAARTKVFFRKLDDRTIENYLDCGEYADKAGAYAVQGCAAAFIDKIDGCFYNVMGLPISATIDLFNEFNGFIRKDI